MIFNIKPLSAYQRIWFFKCIIWKMWKFLPQLFSFLHSETLRWPPNIISYLRVTPYFPDQNKHLLIDLFQTLHKVSLWVALYQNIWMVTMLYTVTMETAAILDFGGLWGEPPLEAIFIWLLCAVHKICLTCITMEWQSRFFIFSLVIRGFSKFCLDFVLQTF